SITADIGSEFAHYYRLVFTIGMHAVEGCARYNWKMQSFLSRNIFDEEHDEFRDVVRRFAEKEVASNLEAWAEAGQVDRELVAKAGEAGILGMSAPELFGGGGVDDFRFNAIVIEELASVGATAVAMTLC